MYFNGLWHLKLNDGQPASGVATLDTAPLISEQTGRVGTRVANVSLLKAPLVLSFLVDDLIGGMNLWANGERPCWHMTLCIIPGLPELSKRNHRSWRVLRGCLISKGGDFKY